MTRMSSSVIIILLLAALPPSARAQDKKVTVNLGGGYTASLSDVRDYFGDGYNIDFGITIHVSETVGIQAEYAFTGLGQKQITLDVSDEPGTPGTPTDFSADMNMQYGDVNLVFKPRMQGNVQPYVLAGVGVYYRPAKITTPGVGFVPGFCSPWWYWCVPGGFVPVENVVGSRSSTDFGMDFGGGAVVMVSDAVSVYIEARYHYIWGPTYTDENGAEQKANGQFFPITFGFRF